MLARTLFLSEWLRDHLRSPSLVVNTVLVNSEVGRTPLVPQATDSLSYVLLIMAHTNTQSISMLIHSGRGFPSRRHLSQLQGLFFFFFSYFLIYHLGKHLGITIITNNFTQIKVTCNFSQICLSHFCSCRGVLRYKCDAYAPVDIAQQEKQKSWNLLINH